MAKVMIIFTALILGVFSRWLPHPPNFTPVIAISIFMGLRLQNRLWVVLTPLLIMGISDLLLGFHITALVTYASLVLFALAIHWLPKQGVWSSKSLQVVGFSLFGSLWFFLASNAGVWWLSGMYAKTFEGLLQSYVAGLPFYQNTLFSTLLFSSFLVLLDQWIVGLVSPSLARS